MNKIDLHIHTTASDGKYTPQEIVDWAIEKKIPTIAIADHDEIIGARKAMEYSKDKNIEVISGIEISCAEPKLNLHDVHIVGLFMDYNNKELLEFVNKMQEERINQKRKMVEKLNELGYKITFEEVKKEAAGGGLGKPHIANVLLRKYPDKFENYRQIFDELLGSGKIADINRVGVYNIKETIDLIHRTGGIAILAHPGLLFENFQKVFKIFLDSNGDGIEVDFNYTYLKDFSQDELVKKFRKIANENNLLISGGTDFHEKGHSVDIGEYGVTIEEFEKLKNSINLH